MPRKSNIKKSGGGSVNMPLKYRNFDNNVITNNLGKYTGSNSSTLKNNMSYHEISDNKFKMGPQGLNYKVGGRSSRRNSNKKYKPYRKNSNKKYKPYRKNSNKPYKPYRKNSNKKYGGSKSKKMRGGACSGCVGLNGFDTSSRQRSTFDIRGRV